MRVLLALLLLSSPALAQQVWTPAPVPNVSTPTVPPADRAGGTGSDSAGPVSGTPFSAAPPTSGSGGGAQGGQTSPAQRDTPGSLSAGTPSLSK